MTSIAVLVGNPSPASRTRHVAEDLAARIAALAPSDGTPAEVLPTIDLAEHTGEIFDYPSERIDELLRQVATADIAVIATPTYKASYTGLLKAFLDRYPTGGLAEITAVPVFTIGSPAHTLAVEHTLRPLLVELGASVPTRGLAFETARFEARGEVLDSWIIDQGHRLPLG